MARHDYLKELGKRAKALRGLFSDRSLKWFQAVLAGQRDDTGRTFGTDKVYEFLCYFTILREIEKTASPITFMRASGPNGYRFTYGPGLKENFAFFRFSFNGETFDLCFGTTLPDHKDSSQPREAPDISLQWMSNKPAATLVGVVTPGTPVRIWDAKYHEEQEFSKHDFQQLYSWCDILGLRPPPSQQIPAGLLPRALERTAVITNARQSPINTRIANAAGLAVVFEFHGNLALVTVVPP